MIPRGWLLCALIVAVGLVVFILSTMPRTPRMVVIPKAPPTTCTTDAPGDRWTDVTVCG